MRGKDSQEKTRGVRQAQQLTDSHLSAAPAQAAGDPVDGDVQVVHLAVVVWSRQVVGAETAEQQSQEEVQQLERKGENRVVYDEIKHKNRLKGMLLKYCIRSLGSKALQLILSDTETC